MFSSARQVKVGVPFLTARDHGVEDNDELAHAGDQGNLLLFAFGDEAAIEGVERRIVPGRSSETSHVEEIADLPPSALDLALAPAFAAVVIIRSYAQQGGRDLVTHMT